MSVSRRISKEVHDITLMGEQIAATSAMLSKYMSHWYGMA